MNAIDVMKQALEAHEQALGFTGSREIDAILRASSSRLREAIARAEKQDAHTISTEHGPWLESTLHEGETYCERCLCRSVFRDKKECKPHIACTTQPATQPEPVQCWKHGDEPRRGCAWCDKKPAPPPARGPLANEQLPPIPSAYRDGAYLGYSKRDFVTYARAVEAAHGIGDQT